MAGRLVVLDHRYVGVSESDGTLTIKDLPVGELLAFRIFHEAIRFAELSIDEQCIDRRQIFWHTIGPRENDLGVLEIGEGNLIPAIER